MLFVTNDNETLFSLEIYLEITPEEPQVNDDENGARTPRPDRLVTTTELVSCLSEVQSPSSNRFTPKPLDFD